VSDCVDMGHSVLALAYNAVKTALPVMII